MAAIGGGGEPPVRVVLIQPSVSVVRGANVSPAAAALLGNFLINAGASVRNPVSLDAYIKSIINAVRMQAQAQAPAAQAPAQPHAPAMPAPAAQAPPPGGGGGAPPQALPPELVQQMIRVLAEMGINMMAPPVPAPAARNPFAPNQPPAQPRQAPSERPAAPASTAEKRSTERSGEVASSAGGGRPERERMVPIRPERGFTPQQRAEMLERVLIASFLLQLGSQAGKGLALAPSQEMNLLQRLNLLNRDLAQLQSEMSSTKGMTASQAQDLAARIGQKQEALKGLIQEMGPSASLSALLAEKQMGDPLDSLAHLQHASDQITAKLEKELGGELSQLASRLATLPKGTAGEAAARTMEPSLGRAPQVAPMAIAAEGSILGTQEGAASLKALAALANSAVVNSAAQLGAVTEKMQNREFNFPVAINLFYPISKESQGTIGATKTETGEKKGGGQVGTRGSAKQFPMPMVLVPGGIVLVGDTFGEGRADEQPVRALHLEAYLIGVMPVTNAQFAEWLSDAYEKKQIRLTEKGVVTDQVGKVICKTTAAAPTSQIQTVISGEELLFAPIPKTDRHPVVQVTLLGAELFCKANGFRLPTEAEWEKAAGMAVEEEGKEPVKFRYGFGRNEIGPTFANYRLTFKEESENCTTPAGFFNGETYFTKERRDLQSRCALSPYGCFDMSGNVRQWVQGEAEGGTITKGGSYNTPPFDLRVSARLPADAASCHADIGFRVAVTMH